MTLTAALVLVTEAPSHGALTLVDVAPAVGLAETNETFSANPHDYDHDGDTDVLIAYHDQGAKLWRNDGGVFTTAATFPTFNASQKRIDRHDCAWSDVNLDNLDDVFCTVGRTGNNLVKDGVSPDNELWLQQLDGTFVDQGTEWGLGGPYGRGRDAVFFDANGDEWPDLFVNNTLPRAGDPDTALGNSKLFINQSGTGFLEGPEYGLDNMHGGNCALAADIDGDQDEDVVLCGQNGVRIFHNVTRVAFSDVTAASGFRITLVNGVEKTEWYSRLKLVDLDRDSDLDLIGVRKDRVSYRLNNGQGVFAAAKVVGLITGGREVAAGDLEGDGDVDIYALSDQNPATGVDVADTVFLNGPRLVFARQTLPHLPAGRGDTVESLDYNGDTRADFLVLNGKDPVRGPTQLITWTGSSTPVAPR